MPTLNPQISMVRKFQMKEKMEGAYLREALNPED